jgi:DNA polymerase-1
LPKVLQALDAASLVGLDTETTGLDPRRDKVRLLQLATETNAFVLDLARVPSEALGSVFELLSKKTVISHNSHFDLQFLAPIGFTPGSVHCTMLLSQLLHGPRRTKGFHTLEQVALREIGVALEKDLQRSDWCGELSNEQLGYAAMDASVLLPLYLSLSTKVKLAGLDRVADIERRCLPAILWLSKSGVPFDFPAWEALARDAAQEAEALALQVTATAPAPPGGGSWNWNSWQQVQKVFALVGVKLKSTGDDALAAVDHPLASLLRKYRAAAKRVSTYGTSWLKDAFSSGRLFTDWKQMGCVTGRMASASPNLQNLPGDSRYRACFRAPEGRVLVKADYSQIEMRITAKIANDPAMLGAYSRGDDLHTLTARRMLGREDITPSDRKLAKPVNFGLIYGLGTKSLRAKAKAEYGLDLTLEDAERYRRAFFAGYPGIVRWHRLLRRETTSAVRTLAGRRCPLPEKHFYGTKANYVVQGTGGDGLKLALALLWERRDQCPGAFPVLAVHDEIVVEADADQADVAATWLKQAMTDAMAPLIAPVPVEVKAAVGATWASGE